MSERKRAPVEVVLHRFDRGALRLLADRDGSTAAPAADAIRTLDRLAIPDGCPFVLAFDGSPTAVQDINEYLIGAVRHRAISARTASSSAAYHLLRALRFVRSRASVNGHTASEVRLIDTTDADLVAYRDERRQHISARSWNTELAALAGFFDWAVANRLIERSPVPRWGTRQRGTLAAREALLALPRYLTEPQLRAFLTVGLRGDHVDPAPTYGERDYALGLTLVSTGLRREEAAMLLDFELPTLVQMPPDGIFEFVRYGKGMRPRRIYVTTELVAAVELYRTTTRQLLVRAAQPTLRRRRRNGALITVDDIVPTRAGSAAIINGKKTPIELLTNEDRARAIRVTPDGSLEPLGLFLTRFGLPARITTWNTTFTAAEDRLRKIDHPDQPPAHVTVTPHTLRHTFAIRMLAALMRLGRDRAANPYYLLASPLITVQHLMGHVSPDTTRRYLVAAEKYDDLLPAALREHVARAAGIPS